MHIKENSDQKIEGGELQDLHARRAIAQEYLQSGYDFIDVTINKIHPNDKLKCKKIILNHKINAPTRGE